MGSGASRRRANRSESRSSTIDEELKKMCRNRRQSAVGVGDVDADDIDAESWVEAGQLLLHAGVVWKLNFGASPDQPEEWLKRKMWLTTTGSLFYFSSRSEAPLGRSIWDFNIVKVDAPVLDRFVIELYAKADVKNKLPTILATETAEERDEWLSHFEDLQSGGDDSEHVQPYERYGDHKRAQAPQFPQAPQLVLPRADDKTQAGCFSHSLAARIFRRLSRTLSAEEGGDLEMKPAASRNADGWNVLHVEGTGDLEVAINSQELYAQREQTLLVLDWDDTLFPTSFLTGDCNLNWRYPLKDQAEPGPSLDELERVIARYSVKVEEFLRSSCSMATVVIVTLARTGWVKISSNNFIPCLIKLIEELGIEVIYVRDVMPEDMRREDVAGMFKSRKEESDFWIRAKASAMKSKAEAVYAGQKSWKNIISIGDSDYERLALRKIAREHMRSFMTDPLPTSAADDGIISQVVCKDGYVRKLRAKTVKLLEDPSLDMMVAEMVFLTSWMPYLVERNNTVDIQIGDPDDDAGLNAVNKQITGRDDELSWVSLAGLEDEENVSKAGSQTEGRQSPMPEN